jgi:hypothetical protein
MSALWKLLLISFAVATFCHGATLTGVVKDPAGKVIPNVPIELRNQATGQQTTVQTDGAGRFQFTGLAPDQYSLKVAASGFQTENRTLNLVENAAGELEIQLKIAELVQEVEVSGKGRALANSDSNYRRLRNAVPETTFQVENLTLTRDVGTLTLRKGSVTFTPAVLGRVTTGVFVGEAEFALEPLLPIEKRYLVSLTQKESVKEKFNEAVFVFTDETCQEIQRDGHASATDPRAADVLRQLRNRLRHRPDQPRSMVEALLTSESMDNVEADTLADLYNPKHVGFFTAYISGAKHGDLRFHVRPGGAMLSLPSPEEAALINVEPQGTEDGIWYLSHYASEMKSGTASSSEDKRTIAAENYRIETAIGKNDHLSAVAEMRFRAVAGGDRLIKFGLLPALRVTRVSMPGGREVAYIQEDRKQDGSLYVVMPEPMEKGGAYQLVIEYEGDRVIHKAGGGNFSVGARTSWYPSVNAFNDRAKFDLTFKVPKSYTLVSVGNLVKEWKEGDFAATQWVSDVPLPVAGFNYGTFTRKEVRDEATKYLIQGYATAELPDYLKGAEAIGGMTPSRLTDQALVETQNAIRLYTHWFGPAPYGRIAITQQPEFNFGQSWPGLVYLPLSAYLDSTQRWQLMGRISTSLAEFVQEVTPHEVAHQWWGHMVGWASYRDQWLSEGFADFSAGLYLQATEKKPDKYLAYWERAREMILEKNNFGRSANDAGPLWLGMRLDTYRNGSAYRKLIYPKGGYVLHMLRSMMFDPATGDEAFIKMMHDFVDSNSGRNASTESFKAVVDKHMKPSMDLEGDGKANWFFREWVYGTEIPRYKLAYNLQQDQDGKWALDGSLTQSEVSDNFRMIVPLYGEFSGHLRRIGQIRVSGNATVPIKVRFPEKPKRLMINAYHDVLEMK